MSAALLSWGWSQVTRGVRVGAAQQLLDDQLASGVAERTAFKNVARVLGRNRTAMPRRYAP